MVQQSTVRIKEAEELAKDPPRLRLKFWGKLRQLAGSLPFAEDLLAAYYCAFDPATPRRVKAALFGAIAYFVVPLDFLPDVLPILGFTDDAAVLAAAIRIVASHITPAHRAKARAAIDRGVVGNDTSPPAKNT